MSDLRGLSAATSEEGSRPKHERLHRAAMPELCLLGWRQGQDRNDQAVLSSVSLSGLGEMKGVAEEVEQDTIRIIEDAR
jgi:hypothetical protein